MKCFVIALAVACVSCGDLPTNISPQHMKLSDDFYPETARDVVIAPEDNTIPDSNHRRSLTQPSLTPFIEGEALGKILLALRYLHLIRPNTKSPQDPTQQALEYGTKVTKLFEKIRAVSKTAFEKLSKQRRSFSEKKRFCEHLRKAAKKLEMNDSPIDSFEKIYRIKSKMSRAILDIVDMVAESILKNSGEAMENVAYKFAAVEKMAEFASIILHPITTDKSNDKIKEMCATF